MSSVQVFRIVKAKYATIAFEGEGAKNNDGRWHHKGYPVVYASENLSLAALEVLVNLDSFPPSEIEFCSVSAIIPKTLIKSLENLPENWNKKPNTPKTQDCGTLWLRSNESAVLQIPSVLIPTECNYLLNPLHPDFKKITINKPLSFVFDQRLNKH